MRSGLFFPQKSIVGVKCCRTTFDLPSSPDAVFVGVNREKTVSIIEELSKIDAGGVACFASGFSETSVDDKSEQGKTLKHKIDKVAGQMPILSPNYCGFINYLDNALIWSDQHAIEQVNK